MRIDSGATWHTVKDGITEVSEVAHEKVSSFHDNYVSKVIPDCGRYGDAAKFVAEMIPGVAEYNAIKDGDWVAFAIAAGIDVAAIAIGAFTAGAGYAAVKGGGAAAKAGVRVAAKEIAEAGAEVIVREVVEAGVEKAVKETVEAGVEVVVRETVEAGVEKVVKETAENVAEKAVKETVEAGTKTVAKDTTEAGVEKIVLEVGDKIDVTRFPDYVDEIEQITNRKILPQQKELVDDALKKTDFSKLGTEGTKLAREEFKFQKKSLIEMWEKMTASKWPKYADDVLNDAGDVIRRAGQPYDAHHIIELSVGGPNEWWNLHPARFPSEHQNGIHAAGRLAKIIFE